MALRRILSKRLLSGSRNASSPTATAKECASISAAADPLNFARSSFHHDSISSPDLPAAGIFCRFLQRRAINHQSASSPLPSFLTLPAGDDLREKLKSLNVPIGEDSLRLDALSVPFPPSVPEEGKGRLSVNVSDLKKLLKCAQLEKVIRRLRDIPSSTITYGEFVSICGDACGNGEVGPEFAKALDDSGNVVVLGEVVFLHPDQVAKSVEILIAESVSLPGDPRREEFAHLETKKAFIDKKAQSLVRRELYFGLGFLVLQTLGFMRLTFWELTWDVMEPICFFGASFHFMLAYTFFLRTSKEPCFEGFFHRRFKVKQKKLIRIKNFDLERYNQLRTMFHPEEKKLMRESL